MISIFTGYKAKNSSTKWGYSQNLLQLRGRLLCTFVTWVIEIPCMIMFLRPCIGEIPIWNRKHYFLKTGLPLNSVMFCVYSSNVRITSVFNSSTFFSAEHKEWMAVVIWWWGKYKNTLSILYVLKCAISECFIFVLYTQGNKAALIQGWIMA
jgi:hypothetical protein